MADESDWPAWQELEAANARNYRELTFASYGQRLEEYDPEVSAGIGVAIRDKPAGLVLARLDEKPLAHILSLYVAPECRRRGLAALLLNRLEAKLAGVGFAEIEISYRSGRAATPGLEALLAHEGWSEPRVRQIYCRTSGRKMSEAGWMQSMALPAEYEVIAWSEVTDADRGSIRERQAREPFFPEELDPLRHEAGYEPMNSLGLRFRGEIVGWMITHPAGENCLRYTCSYLRPDLQSVGRLVALYSEALRRQIAGQGLDCVGLWTVPVNQPRMAAFVRRRFAPFLLDLAEFRLSRKSLIAKEAR